MRSIKEMNEFLHRRKEQQANPTYTAVGECPDCHGEVVTAGSNYHCLNPECGFSFRRDKLRNSNKPEITLSEMSQLLRGEVIDLPGLIGKKGPYDCGGRLVLTDQYGWDIDFCQRPRRSMRRGQGPTSSGPVPEALRRYLRAARQGQENPQPDVAESGEPRTSNTAPFKLTLKRKQE